MSTNRVTQKDIARALGLSTQAVSMALRDHRGIAESTRRRVRQQAAVMGYRADPALQSLAAYRSRVKRKDTPWTTYALVHDWPSQEQWKNNGYTAQFEACLVRSAEKRGIRIEGCWLGHQGIAAEGTFRRLYNRGIVGIIVGPHSMDLEPKMIQPPGDRFQVVTSGPEHLYPDYLTVQVDFYENLRLAWQVLVQKGCRRIGLVFHQRQGWRTNDTWSAAYEMEKGKANYRLGDLPILIITGRQAESLAAFRVWFQQYRPDAIIDAHHRVRDWLREMKEEAYVAEMNPDGDDRPGIDLNMPHLTDAIVDTLTLAMQRSLTQESTFPYRVHIPGRWREGDF